MSNFPERLLSQVDGEFIDERDLRAAAVYVDLALRTLEGAAKEAAEASVTDNVWIAIARTLAAFRDQHTCVELTDHPDWEDDLRKCTVLVAEPHTINTQRRQPFILDLNRLYIHRSGPVLVALAAPTGKAAKRMTEAMDRALTGAPEHVRKTILGSPAKTVHSLLGANPGRVDGRFTYHAGNKLKFNIVIVDEVSMMSLSMMYHLLAALPDETKLVLVGDPDQLASVDAGTVLADIVSGSPEGRIQKLETQHRFKDAPNIVAAANAIREGNVEATLAAISGNKADVQWIDANDSPELAEQVLESVVSHAKEVIKLASEGQGTAALALKSTMQVLCAHRNGKMGVAGWNKIVEQRLGPATANQWYVGRPSGLFNGDVAIIGSSEHGRVACFSTNPDAESIPVSRLPDVETVHALTIHKSQGSEYDHVVVVLPEGDSRILNRELLYTGITRAKQELTIIGSQDVVFTAVQTQVRRATGLGQRLRSPQAVAIREQII